MLSIYILNNLHAKYGSPPVRAGALDSQTGMKYVIKGQIFSVEPWAVEQTFTTGNFAIGIRAVNL